MKSWREWLLDEQKNKHPDGTYVSVQLSDESTNQLYKWVKSNNINNPIDPKLPDNEYHVTIVYSPKGIPEAEGEDIGLPLKAKITGWEIFDAKDGSKCLVGKIDNKSIVDAHKMFREKYGATYTHPSYIPHLTVSYDYGNGPKPKAIPDFELTFDKREFKALDPTYKPSNEKDK